MLDSAKAAQYNAFKTSYCSLLEKWKLNTKMVEVQNHINTTSPSSDIGNLLRTKTYSVALKNSFSALKRILQNIDGFK